MEVRKVKVGLFSAYRLLYPRHVVLVSCTDKAGKANVITLAWSMPVSISPPMIAISIAPKRYSHRLIEETKEFVVNVPTMDMVKETLFCGRRSGRTYDKFKETQLTPLPAKMVQTPIIKECVAHLECKLDQQITVGDHTLFIGSVLTAYADEGVFDEKFDLKKVKPIYHMGGDDFVTVVPEIVSPRL
ncbi:MAG: flavin reductase family protein [Candidatus Bathyarchaeia archaeon]